MGKEAKSKCFQVGDLAVYPAHGVVRIESIESREVEEEMRNFYILKVLDNGMIIMVPTDNVASVGLREIIKKEEVPLVYEIMEKKENAKIETLTWNRRYKEYMDKIKTGSLYDVAEVYRDLSILKLSKDLSFGERKLYDTAQLLLIKEISTALEEEEEDVEAEIKSFFEDIDDLQISASQQSD